MVRDNSERSQSFWDSCILSLSLCLLSLVIYSCGLFGHQFFHIDFDGYLNSLYEKIKIEYYFFFLGFVYLFLYFAQTSISKRRKRAAKTFILFFLVAGFIVLALLMVPVISRKLFIPILAFISLLLAGRRFAEVYFWSESRIPDQVKNAQKYAFQLLNIIAIFLL